MPLQSKTAVAERLIARVAELLEEKPQI